MRRVIAALAVVLAAGCMGSTAHTRSQPVGYSAPEPDPSCLGIVAQCRTISGVQQVVMKVGVSREGKVAFLDILTPELTAADAVEVRRALDGCMWKPAVGPNGERVEGTFTLAIQR